MRVLFVCTGNICRSPLAETVLRARLDGLDVGVSSAGVGALVGAPMTPEAAALAVQHGATREDVATHRARSLTATMAQEADLILTMTRDQRRAVTALAPARLRHTFTVREFARLAAHAPNDELRSAARTEATDVAGRLRRVAAQLAALRGLVGVPGDEREDDVEDPYRRPVEVYVRSTQQLLPALDGVERVLRAVTDIDSTEAGERSPAP